MPTLVTNDFFLHLYHNILNWWIYSVPEDYKKNPGAVEAIAEQPGHPDSILIGYNRGLMVLWNKATPGAQQVSNYNHNYATFIVIVMSYECLQVLYASS